LASPTGADGVGASGIIFGWFGYLIVRGFFNHDKVDIFVGLLVMTYYLPIFTLLLPAPHLGYQLTLEPHRWRAVRVDLPYSP
jgi:membrane associated rhomboid family serine protease